jgi:ribosome-associated heat shock protein Hsp15
VSATGSGGGIRLDKWLWHARFFRSRSLAAAAIAAGTVRVNAQRVTRPGRTVAPGDVLTFVQGARVRVVRVAAPGVRRGPAAEAAALYHDLDPAAPATPAAAADPPQRVEGRAPAD